MNFRRIEVSELPKKIPNYKKSSKTKDILVYEWIKAWITAGLKNNTLKVNELLPSKADMAYHLGVSIGTVQNAIRYVEDEGYFESKQKIGTLIKDQSAEKSQFRKLTSKREKMILELKKYILDNNYKIGDTLPTAKEIGKIFNSSSNTTRLALENLLSTGIISIKDTKSIESSWIVSKIPKLSKEHLNNADGSIQAETLVSKVEENLKDYIKTHYKIGQKLSAHSELAKELGVSIKTIHDAMSGLIEDGYLLAHRGRYGTTVIKLPGSVAKQEESIFAPAKDAAFYNYQKIENYLRNLIKDNYEVGDKLPAMEVLSQDLKVSTNTIKKALQNLSNQGYVKFTRGRYGGTFILDVPESTTESSFKWLAVNPQYVKVYKN